MPNILNISREALLNHFVPQDYYTLVESEGFEVFYMTAEYETVTFEFEGE